MDKAQLHTLLARIDVWLLIFGVIVVVGVGGESFFGIRHLWNTRKFQAIKEAENRQREETIARLNQEAAQLRKDAEGLKADNLKLAAQIAPRRLTLGQQVKTAENCARFKHLFKGKSIKLVSYSLDTEAFVLAEQVVAALRMKPCEMTVDDEAMSITPVMSTLVFGIQVFGSDSELAKRIAEAIGSSGRPIAVSFVESDPTAGAVRFETRKSLLAHDG